MQLRVARLCLNCEELHVDQSCPRCASETYAFLSEWLPSEERRRWRRPSPRPAVVRERSVEAVAHAFVRWFRGERDLSAPTQPTTRRADQVVHLDFDKSVDETPKTPVVESPWSKGEGRITR